MIKYAIMVLFLMLAPLVISLLFTTAVQLVLLLLNEIFAPGL